MTRFKPSDEMSLRHLFSSAFAESELGLSYVGPVLNTTGAIESSPDAMILDMRKRPFALLRCEFKYEPTGAKDFEHNGNFDIAVVWSLRNAPNPKQLRADLLSQNGCSELLPLDDVKAFHDLQAYSLAALKSVGGADALEKLKERVLRSREYDPVFVLCIAAQLYPDSFHMAKMLALLRRRFPRVKKMPGKGAANVVTAFAQGKPPYLLNKYGKYWRWSGEPDSGSAAGLLIQLARTNFEKDPPSKEDLAAVRG